MAFNFLLSLFIAYMIGSIPTGYLFTKAILKIDIRNYGSGNVGATNVARKLGLKMGIVVAVIDILKGFFPVLLARSIILPDKPEYLIFLVGFAAIIGHDWSIFLKFDGGKGVATTFGVILGLNFVSFLILLVIWLAIAVSTRIVSLASIFGTLTLPLSIWYLRGLGFEAFLALLLFLFVLYTHRENIKRLLAGEEKQITFGSDKSS
ncbi:MAG: glycerol-3-phosphate 1-O-acyltransferase PlsY [Bacillota bacterium]